jgi:hypothetical protein
MRNRTTAKPSSVPPTAIATFDTGMAFRGRLADLAVNHLADTEQSEQSQR